MSAIAIIAVSFAISQVVLSILLLYCLPRVWSTQEWLFSLFLYAVIAYLLGPLLEQHWLGPTQIAWQNTLPGLFWLFCGSIFNDKFKLTWWNVVLVASTVILPTIAKNVNVEGLTIPVWLFITLPQLVEFVLIAWAILIVTQSWRDDLVEMRRDLRFWFCFMAGIYIFIMIAIREVFYPNATWWTELQFVPIGVIALATNLLILRYRAGLFQEQHTALQKADYQMSDTETRAQPNLSKETAASSAQTVTVPEEITNQLHRLMNEQRIYREMGLTIGQVAERLDVQEYRLRRIINAGMGHRNFNDYLNGFRIEEAGQRLSDPEQHSEAILNIALDTGFRSLSSFNKAFKEVFGQTPTEYRKLARSRAH